MSTGAAEPLAYRIKEFARQIGVSERTIHREISAGNLKARKFRKIVVILAEDAKAYLENDEARNQETLTSAA